MNTTNSAFLGVRGARENFLPGAVDPDSEKENTQARTGRKDLTQSEIASIRSRCWEPVGVIAHSLGVHIESVMQVAFAEQSRQMDFKERQGEGATDTSPELSSLQAAPEDVKWQPLLDLFVLDPAGVLTSEVAYETWLAYAESQGQKGQVLTKTVLGRLLARAMGESADRVRTEDGRQVRGWRGVRVR